MKLSVKSIGSYFRTKLSLRDPDNWRENGGRSTSGEAVTVSNVVGLSTVWACVTLLAGTTGSLTIGVYKKTGRVLAPVVDHPLYNLLAVDPNYDQAADEFWEYIQASIELRGNGYAEKKRGVMGNLVALDPIAPDVMTVSRLRSGKLEYRWIDGFGKQRIETDENILHIRGPMGNPLGGMSCLSACANVFGGALAGDKTAQRSLRNGISTGGGVEMDKALNAKQRKELREHLRDDYSSATNAGTPMILDNGLKWKTISLSPEDLQLLATRKFSVEEICRIFGVPPHMVQHMEGNTTLGSSITEQTLAFVTYTLRRRLKRIEKALQKQLLTPADKAAGIRIKFDLRGLLRGDDKGRAEYYERGIRNGYMTINEVRELENLPPVEGGDEVRVQMQNVLLVDADGNVTKQGDA